MFYCSEPKTYCEQWPDGCIVCELEMCDGKKETAEKNVSNKILPCEPCKPTQPECGDCEFVEQEAQDG